MSLFVNASFLEGTLAASIQKSFSMHNAVIGWFFRAIIGPFVIMRLGSARTSLGATMEDLGLGGDQQASQDRQSDANFPPQHLQ